MVYLPHLESVKDYFPLKIFFFFLIIYGIMIMVIFMKNRSELRDAIVKILYQIQLFEEAKIEYNLDDLIKEQVEVENDFVNDCIQGILKNKKKIVDLANHYLKDWTMDRLNKVDQAILSLGIYELLYTDTPSIVAINEAIELSKVYSDEAVTKMINGVLDKIYHDEEK